LGSGRVEGRLDELEGGFSFRTGDVVVLSSSDAFPHPAQKRADSDISAPQEPQRFVSLRDPTGLAPSLPQGMRRRRPRPPCATLFPGL
jgi:hypothetical protein